MRACSNVCISAATSAAERGSSSSSSEVVLSGPAGPADAANAAPKVEPPVFLSHSSHSHTKGLVRWVKAVRADCAASMKTRVSPYLRERARETWWVGERVVGLG